MDGPRLILIRRHVNKPTDFFPYNDDRLPYNSRQYIPKFLWSLTEAQKKKWKTCQLTGFIMEKAGRRRKSHMLNCNVMWRIVFTEQYTEGSCLHMFVCFQGRSGYQGLPWFPLCLTNQIRIWRVPQQRLLTYVLTHKFWNWVISLLCPKGVK